MDGWSWGRVRRSDRTGPGIVDGGCGSPESTVLDRVNRRPRGVAIG